MITGIVLFGGCLFVGVYLAIWQALASVEEWKRHQ